MTRLTLVVTDADFEATANAVLALFEDGQYGAALRLDELARQMNNALSGFDASQSPLEVDGLRGECEQLARQIDARA